MLHCKCIFALATAAVVLSQANAADHATEVERAKIVTVDGVSGSWHWNYRNQGKNVIKGGFVASTARVVDSAFVGPEAKVLGSSSVEDSARIYGNAVIAGEASIRGQARVFGNARVDGSAIVQGSAEVSGDAHVTGLASIEERSRIMGNSLIGNTAIVSGRSIIRGYTELLDGEHRDQSMNNPMSDERRKREAAEQEAARIAAEQAIAEQKAQLALKRTEITDIVTSFINGMGGRSWSEDWNEIRHTLRPDENELIIVQHKDWSDDDRRTIPRVVSIDGMIETGFRIRYSSPGDDFTVKIESTDLKPFFIHLDNTKQARALLAPLAKYNLKYKLFPYHNEKLIRDLAGSK